MKKLKYIFFSLILTSQVFSQENDVSYITQNRDTLFLIDNYLGKLIEYSWEIGPKDVEKPTIIFKSMAWIENKNKLKIRKDELIR